MALTVKSFKLAHSRGTFSKKMANFQLSVHPRIVQCHWSTWNATKLIFHFCPVRGWIWTPGHQAVTHPSTNRAQHCLTSDAKIAITKKLQLNKLIFFAFSHQSMILLPPTSLPNSISSSHPPPSASILSFLLKYLRKYLRTCTPLRWNIQAYSIYQKQSKGLMLYIHLMSSLNRGSK